jgi:hypothetical protein
MKSHVNLALDIASVLTDRQTDSDASSKEKKTDYSVIPFELVGSCCSWLVLFMFGARLINCLRVA